MIKIMLRWCALQSFEAARIPTQQKWRSLRGITLCAISAEMKTEVSAMTAETEKQQRRHADREYRGESGWATGTFGECSFW